MKVGAQAFEKPKKIFNIDNTENKSGSITHFIDLKVQTKGTVKDMRFLIADIGTKNLLLGYPWLAAFEPGFRWQPAIMDHINFPVILSSSMPSPSKTIIAALTTTDKTEIVNQLEEQCTIRVSRTYLGGRPSACDLRETRRYKTCGSAQRRYWQYGSQRSWRRKPFA